MTSNPEISVIMPIYNGAHIMAKAIDSVLAQTYTQYELLIVNNSSTDNTSEVIQRYVQQFPFVRTINHNGTTPSESQNAGLDNARGKYVCILHADDYYHPDFLKKMVTCAQDNNSDMVLCGYKNVDENDTLIDTHLPTKWERGINECSVYSDVYVWHRLYRLAFLNENNIRFSHKKYPDDLYFSRQCQFLAKNIATIPEPLFLYRVSKSSLSGGRSYRYNMDYTKIPYELFAEMIPKVLHSGYTNDRQIFEFFFTYDCMFLSTIFIRYTNLKTIKIISQSMAKILRDNFKQLNKNPYFKFGAIDSSHFSALNVMFTQIYRIIINLHLEYVASFAVLCVFRTIRFFRYIFTKH